MSEPDSKHDLLLKVSPGYREFVQEQIEAAADEAEPDYLVKGFADWYLITRAEALEYADRTAEQWRAEWDRWNS